MPCASGTYKVASGSATCTACLAGTFKPLGGPGACLSCEAGTYQAASNASECTACPTDTVSSEGSTGLSSCVCSAGYRSAYRDVTGCTRVRGEASGSIRNVSDIFGVGTRKVTVNKAMQWRIAAGPPQQRFDQSVAGLGGKLYMFGDEDYSSLLSFDPQVLLLVSCGSRISARTRCHVPAC